MSQSNSSINTGNKKLVIGIDYAMAQSAVAYAKYDDRHPGVSRVQNITNFPRDRAPYGARSKSVLTEIFYGEREMLLQELGEGYLNVEAQHIMAQNASSGRSMPQNVLWGYDIRHLQRTANSLIHTVQSVKDIKFLFLQRAGKEEPTQAYKAITQHVKQLLATGKIEKASDIHADYLTFLVRHTKEQLLERGILEDGIPIILVLTVPVIYGAKERRELHQAMNIAIQRESFGPVTNGCAVGLSFVTEQEAGATYMLQRLREIPDLLPGNEIPETFTYGDIGGSTADFGTWETGGKETLRLKKEVVPLTSGVCGSSCLNAAMEKYALETLEDFEQYIVDKERGQTLRSVVQSRIILPFEEIHKPEMDYNDPSTLQFKFDLPGLPEDKDRGFSQGVWTISMTETRRIIEPIFNQNSSLLIGQVESAAVKGVAVDVAIVSGGFARNRALIRYLKDRLNVASPKTRLLYLTDDMMYGVEDAVSCGAVLRALDKENGPDRYTQCSYGLLRHMVHDEKSIPQQRGAQPWKGKDGLPYISSITWFIQKGAGPYAPFETFPVITSLHYFALNEPALLCEEIIYVADSPMASNYPVRHRRNRRSEVAAKVVFDAAHLRHKLPIVVADPTTSNERQYKLELQIKMVIDGLNIRFQAHWVQDDGTLEVIEGSKQMISMAAAFSPGTN
ncbi:hypothetical protein NA57DRAFT_70177 [Rhizodiscina lignyota]|uniref:Actin-like ATPase domain-containing protein n=1 Tax=Rhizodiscina lignyota TaxID=1504668 RepID=A0A9P4ITG2_9PEZI|nr:hypothetical protein NA57DRAFT_70177 [Rhizodiscina lignyota]